MAESGASPLAAVTGAVAALPTTHAGEAQDPAARARLLSEFTPLLAELKTLTRDAYATLGERRAPVDEVRKELDTASVTLQNLVYEREQLRSRIHTCNELETVYQDVPLRPLDEFQRDAPEAYRSEAVLGDEHQLMVHRLQYELDERRRLEQELKARESEVAALQKTSTEAKRALGGLEKEVRQLMRAAERIGGGGA